MQSLRCFPTGFLHNFDPQFGTITKREVYQGNLRFQVLEAQKVWVAMYGNDWGGGGNPSGDWQQEIVTREAMLEQDWKEIGLLPVKHSNPVYQNEPSWIVFERDCPAGTPS